MPRNVTMDHTRVPWEHDELFVLFNNQMLSEFFSFQQLLQLSTFKDLDFLQPMNWEDIEISWNGLVLEWHKREGRQVDSIKEPVKSLGHVGLTYLMAVFPYEALKDPSAVFSQHEAEEMNLISVYVTQRYLPFLEMPDLFNESPMHPGACSEWMDDRFNRASWWVTYIIYERMHNLPHIYKPDVRVKSK